MLKSENQSSRSLKAILIGKLISLIILFVVFVAGTFYPNFYTLGKIEHKIESRYIEEAKNIGLYEPEFLFENKIQFLDKLETCINFLNFSLHKSERIPKEIIMAQAVLESNYGTSRFAVEGNNLFGIRTWNLKEKHMKPFNSKDTTFGVKVFETKCKCVKYYMKILNNHTAFSDFRRKRALMITANNVDSIKLVNYLSKFATDVDYVKKVKATILKLRNERVQNTN